MSVPASARRRPPGRYDEPSLVGQRVLAVILVVLFFALLAVIVLTLYNRYGSSDVRFRELGFSVVSDTQVRVDFEVAKPADVTAYCAVRARNADGAETGREVVRIGPDPDGERVVQVRHSLTTRERAVTGEVERCTLQAPRAERLSP